MTGGRLPFTLLLSAAAASAARHAARPRTQPDDCGRAEIIDAHQGLDAATAGIASELSQQYLPGYSSSAPGDGRWHTIEVRLRKGTCLVRARKGFISGGGEVTEVGASQL